VKVSVSVVLKRTMASHAITCKVARRGFPFPSLVALAIVFKDGRDRFVGVFRADSRVLPRITLWSNCATNA
jgi:hypothetical protein